MVYESSIKVNNECYDTILLHNDNHPTTCYGNGVVGITFVVLDYMVYRDSCGSGSVSDTRSQLGSLLMPSQCLAILRTYSS